VARFALSAVHAAAEQGRVMGGGARYRERLLPYLLEYVRMVQFTEAVLLELRDADFIRTSTYGGVDYDAYGVAISQTLQERFGLEGLVTWYVKFTMEKNDEGDLVLMASLHEPEESLRRVGGTLPISFFRRDA
jgi:hypothetical protein